MADGLVVLSSRGGQQLWTLVKLRKLAVCVSCDRGLGPRVLGHSQAFAPITNGQNRADRVCVTCVDEFSKGIFH